MGCQLINPMPPYSDMQDNGIKHFKIIPNKSCSNNNKKQTKVFLLKFHERSVNNKR